MAEPKDTGSDSPGPAFVALPGYVGANEKNQNSMKPRSPAFTFGMKLPINVTRNGPGPAAYNTRCYTAKDCANHCGIPGFTIGPKSGPILPQIYAPKKGKIKKLFGHGGALNEVQVDLPATNASRPRAPQRAMPIQARLHRTPTRSRPHSETRKSPRPKKVEAHPALSSRSIDRDRSRSPAQSRPPAHFRPRTMPTQAQPDHRFEPKKNARSKKIETHVALSPQSIAEILLDSRDSKDRDTSRSRSPAHFRPRAPLRAMPTQARADHRPKPKQNTSTKRVETHLALSPQSIAEILRDSRDTTDRDRSRSPAQSRPPVHIRPRAPLSAMPAQARSDQRFEPKKNARPKKTKTHLALSPQSIAEILLDSRDPTDRDRSPSPSPSRSLSYPRSRPTSETEDPDVSVQRKFRSPAHSWSSYQSRSPSQSGAPYQSRSPSRNGSPSQSRSRSTSEIENSDISVQEKFRSSSHSWSSYQSQSLCQSRAPYQSRSPSRNGSTSQPPRSTSEIDDPDILYVQEKFRSSSHSWSSYQSQSLSQSRAPYQPRSPSRNGSPPQTRSRSNSGMDGPEIFAHKKVKTRQPDNAGSSHSSEKGHSSTISEVTTKKKKTENEQSKKGEQANNENEQTTSGKVSNNEGNLLCVECTCCCKTNKACAMTEEK